MEYKDYSSVSLPFGEKQTLHPSKDNILIPLTTVFNKDGVTQIRSLSSPGKKWLHHRVIKNSKCGSTHGHYSFILCPYPMSTQIEPTEQSRGNSSSYSLNCNRTLCFQKLPVNAHFVLLKMKVWRGFVLSTLEHSESWRSLSQTRKLLTTVETIKICFWHHKDTGQVPGYIKLPKGIFFVLVL